MATASTGIKTLADEISEMNETSRIVSNAQTYRDDLHIDEGRGNESAILAAMDALFAYVDANAATLHGVSW